MSNNYYSKICNHTRLQRINNNFVRCLECGQSMISQKKHIRNKTRQDFTKENKSFIRNFDRNFSNVIEEVDETSNTPMYEYYADKMMANKIIVNRAVAYQSLPPKYEVIVNGNKIYITDQEISKLLTDIGAIRVDQGLMKSRFLNH